MEIPNYMPTEEAKKICGLDHIRIDDVFKVIFDMPVKEEDAFQIVEELTDTDTAVEFFRKDEGQVNEARKKFFILLIKR